MIKDAIVSVAPRPAPATLHAVSAATEIPSRSFTASCSFCLLPMYRGQQGPGIWPLRTHLQSGHRLAGYGDHALTEIRRFRLPRRRRRQTTPPHSRSSNRLKQETARPSQSQDDPSFPAGSGIRKSPSSPCRVAGNPVCRSVPGSARSPGYSCPSVR